MAEPAPAAGGRRVRAGFQRPSRAVFWVLMVLGALLRLQLARRSFFINSDGAVVYLMALHASHGHFQAFFWGQAYGGTLLATTAAAAFRVVGVHVWALEAVASTYFLAASFALRSLVSRLWDPVLGDVAGAALWFPGITLLYLTLFDPGFYGPAILLGLLLLLAATSPRLKTSWAPVLLMGLLVGLALWTAPSVLAFAVPAVALALYRRPPWNRLASASLVAAVGALPWLVFNLNNHFLSLTAGHSPLTTLPMRVGEYLTLVLPAAVHAELGSVPRVLIALVVLLVLGGSSVAAVVTRRWDRAALCASGLLGVLVITYSSVDLVPAANRYALFVLPVLLPLFLAALARLGRLRSTALALALGSLVVGSLNRDATTIQGQTAPFPSSLVQLGRVLRSRGVTAVYADYWISYALTATTGERVTAAALLPRRFSPYEHVAAARKDTVVVVFSGEQNSRVLSSAPNLPRVESKQVGPYTILFYSGRVDPYQLAPSIEGVPNLVELG